MNVRDNSPAPSAETDEPGSKAAATRVQGLLSAVVAACECMVQQADLMAGLQAAVEQLGRLSGHDRAYVFELTDDQAVCVLIAEWDAPGIPRISDMAGMTRFAVADYTEVWAPLLAGRAYQSVTPIKTGANAWLNEAVANRSDVMVPIFVGDRCWGCIGFDNCTEERRYSEAEIQALRGAAAAVAASLQRSQAEAERQHAVRARAERAEADAVALREREGLLQTVTLAARQLLAGRDFDSSVTAALALLGPACQAVRAGLFQDLGVTGAGGLGRWRMTHEWHAAGVPAQLGSLAAEGEHPSLDAVARSRAGQHVVLRIGDNESQFDGGQNNIATMTILSVPVFASGLWWGVVAFDDERHDRDWAAHEIAVLQVAASCIGAALERQQAEALRLGEAQALNVLTQGVVRATRELLDSAEFNAGLQQWLAYLGEAARADVAVLIDIGAGGAPHDGTVADWSHGWRRDGQPFQSLPIPSTRDFDDWLARLLAQQSVWADIDQLVDPASVQFWRDTDCATNLLMPVVVSNAVRYVLCFDWRERHGHSPASEAVLRTAAESLSAVLHRQMAFDALLGERESRIAAEKQRADEKEDTNQLLEGVVRASRALLDATDFNQGLQDWLGFLAQAVNADSAGLGSFSPPLPDSAVTSISAYWARDMSLPLDVPVPATTDFVAWAERLQRGEWVWAHREDLEDPASVDFWVTTACVTSLVVPVVRNGRGVAWVGFDWRERQAWRPALLSTLLTAADGAAAALHRQEATLGLLAERERRIAIERRRADEAAVLVVRIERHVHLLEAVARAAEILLSAPTASQGMDRVLEILCMATGADRVCYAHFEFTPADAELHGWRHITHEWNRPGTVRKLDTGSRSVPMRRADGSWEDKFASLSATGWFRRRVEDLDEPYASELRQMGVVWVLRFAVLAGERIVALLGFDYADPFESFEEATIDALQTVASAIADALLRQELEARALAAERSRADESARLAALLTHVVGSSRTLIDAELQAFEPALLAWLGGFGQAVGAMRCTFYDLVDFESTGLRTARMLAQWVRDGVEGSIPVSFAAPITIDPRGAEPLMERLTAGDAVAFHTEDTVGPMREFLAQQGNATVVAVPLVMDGEPWGCLSFDHAERREPQPGEFAVLQTAADTLAAILKRNEALRHMLAEREARLTAEQQRSTELARVNDALRQALDALADTDGEAAFLRDVLVQLQGHTGARAAYLFRIDDADGRLRLVGRSTDGLFSERPADDDPPNFSRGFEMVPALMAQLRPGGRLLWRRVDPDMPVDDRTSESTRWHLRSGHRANAVQALMIGTRQVGFIGMVFDHDRPLSDAQLDLAHALTQPMTLALELARLARLAQRGSEQAAMLKERNRLAREIHDGIAQSFLAIQMQLDALDDRGTDAHTIQKALHMARHGLTEARRAVAALRPQGLQNSDLALALQRLVQDVDGAATVKTTLVRPTVWQALPTDVEDHLFRIVQEAVNNALRHGRPRHLRVELSQAAGEATVLVSDDGSGFRLDPALVRQGFGLESMQQRAQLIGARIDWLTAPGQGTQVLVSWTSPALAGVPDAGQPKAAR